MVAGAPRRRGSGDALPELRASQFPWMAFGGHVIDLRRAAVNRVEAYRPAHRAQACFGAKLSILKNPTYA